MELRDLTKPTWRINGDFKISVEFVLSWVSRQTEFEVPEGLGVGGGGCLGAIWINQRPKTRTQFLGITHSLVMVRVLKCLIFARAIARAAHCTLHLTSSL